MQRRPRALWRCACAIPSSSTLPGLASMPEPRSFAIRRMALAEDDQGSDASARAGAVVIRPLPPVARFSLRLQPTLLEHAKSVAGFVLNLPINRCQSVQGKRTLRLGPDEWLLCGPQME